jgi:hypothetical protein
MTPRLPWRRRRRPETTGTQPRFPSLDLLLQVAMEERDKQLGHFDALDTKAGVLLAFAGVLIVLSPDIQFAFQLPGIILAALSALLALATFWPRKFPSLDPWVLRQFFTYDKESTGLKVHDTIAEAVTNGRDVLEVKARSLRWALILLLLAAVTFGAGIIVTSHNADGGRKQHGIQGPGQRPVPRRTSASSSPSSSASRSSP